MISMNEDVRCKDTRKLQARKNEQGIFLFCKECRKEHFYPWEELHTQATTTDAINNVRVIGNDCGLTR